MGGGRAPDYRGFNLQKIFPETKEVKKSWGVLLRFAALFVPDLLSAYAMYVMMNYLTNVWNLSITHAAAIINILDGITSGLVIVFAFFVDAFLGDFHMLVLSTIAYSIGFGLLSLSTPTFFGPCSHDKEECIGHKQKVLFFAALPLIAIGIAGHLVSLRSFQEQQKKAQAEARAQAQAADEVETAGPAVPEMKVPRVIEALVFVFAVVLVIVMLLEMVTMILVCIAILFMHVAEIPIVAQAQSQSQADQEEVGMAGSFISRLSTVFIFIMLLGIGMGMVAGLAITLLYVKPWSIQFGVPAICAMIATVWFLTGYPLYIFSKPKGSPLTIGLRVFVAAATKDFQQVKGFKSTYNDDNTQSTNSLRWLEKAATKFPDQAMSKSWTLCSMREVEDTKTGVRMIPLLLTFVGTGLVLSIGNTYFIEQANHMDRRLGKINIPIPFFKLFDTPILNRYHSPLFSKSEDIINTKAVKERRRKVAQIIIATSMVSSVLCCIIAGGVETKRLDVIRKHGLLDKSNDRIPMTVFYLLPQFILLGVVRIYGSGGLKAYLRDTVPESMQRYLSYFQKFVLGLGSMASVLLVYVVGKLSEINNHPNWFQHTSNRSRLDLYYWTLAGLSALSMICFIIGVCKHHNHEQEELGAC